MEFIYQKPYITRCIFSWLAWQRDCRKLRPTLWLLLRDSWRSWRTGWELNLFLLKNTVVLHAVLSSNVTQNFTYFVKLIQGRNFSAESILLGLINHLVSITQMLFTFLQWSFDLCSAGKCSLHIFNIVTMYKGMTKATSCSYLKVIAQYKWQIIALFDGTVLSVCRYVMPKLTLRRRGRDTQPLTAWWGPGTREWRNWPSRLRSTVVRSLSCKRVSKNWRWKSPQWSVISKKRYVFCRFDLWRSCVAVLNHC